MSRTQSWVYRTTDGRIGGTVRRGAPVALLITAGRKTGEPPGAEATITPRTLRPADGPAPEGF